MLLPKDDATLARSFGPTKDRRPTFRFRIDLVPGGPVATPQFVFATDHDDALDKLDMTVRRFWGRAHYEVDGQPMKVSS